jgi:predicted DNA-binding antitoxin AbrB/MazE fold protein
MVQVEAIYRNGTFQPLVPTNLRENQRVRLTVQELEPSDAQQWLARVRQRHEQMIAENRVLPDSTPDIAADRLR